MHGQGRAQFWDSLLKDRVGEQQLEEFEELGKGKRSRRQVFVSLCFSQTSFILGCAVQYSIFCNWTCNRRYLITDSSSDMHWHQFVGPSSWRISSGAETHSSI